MSVLESPEPTREDRRWTLRLGAALAVAALVLHLPGLVGRLFNSDEASLATMAMEIQRGGTLYHETADRKPPVVPYVYALVFEATGRRDLRPVRAVGALALAGTALLLAGEAKRRRGTRAAAVAAGVFFLAGTAANFPADSQAAGFETFMLLPMTGAVVAAGRGQAVVAGLCLALACLCKQTAFVTALPVAYLLVRAGGWPAAARAGAAAAGVIVATAVAFGPADFL
ncbi:MAG TPA: glycosyltransferase family 39 protein, partial [Acidimicrobiales bacterium]